jgi:hypothetical protein
LPVVEFLTVPVRVWAAAREERRRRVISASRRRFPSAVDEKFKFAVLSGSNIHFSRPLRLRSRAGSTGRVPIFSLYSAFETPGYFRLPLRGMRLSSA